MFEYKVIENKEDFTELMKFSFSIPVKEWELLRSRYDLIFGNSGREALGAYAGEELVGEYLLFSLKMRLRESIVDVGGIGNVCSKPLYRGKGAASFLLKNSLRTMRENKQVISLLYPFNMDFYRKYGWEYFDTLLSLKISPASLKIPESEDKIIVREMDNADGDVRNFYNEYASSHYTMVLRDDEFWNTDNVFWVYNDIDKKFVKFIKGDKVRGILRYILMMQNSEKGETGFVVTMFLTDDEETKRAMLRFLKGLSLQIGSVHLLLPPDYRIWPYLSGRPIEQKIANRSMIRIVDLIGLSGLKIDSADMSIRIKISDSQAPWNNGIFELSIENGELQIRLTDKAPQLACDIGTLSAIIGGSTDFKEMIDCKMVEVYDGYDGQNLPRQIPFVLQHF